MKVTFTYSLLLLQSLWLHVLCAAICPTPAGKYGEKYRLLTANTGTGTLVADRLVLNEALSVNPIRLSGFYSLDSAQTSGDIFSMSIQGGTANW
jgi:hypothetical protein